MERRSFVDWDLKFFVKSSVVEGLWYIRYQFQTPYLIDYLDSID